MKTFDPAQCTAVWNGIIWEGYFEGSSIKVTRRADMFNLKVGGDGEGARAKTNDKSGEIVVTFMQSSKSNDAMSVLALLDELSNDGVGPFLLRDLNGSTIVSAESAWIRKFADIELGTDIVGREWHLDSDAINMFVGGST